MNNVTAFDNSFLLTIALSDKKRAFVVSVYFKVTCNIFVFETDQTIKIYKLQSFFVTNLLELFK